MRFIHAADLHLDTAFVTRSDDVRRRLREASRGALLKLVDLALAEDVDAVILAGDLFDGERISFATERVLAAEMQRLCEAGIPVVYATGNHDPGQMESRVAALEWPPNVHLAREAEPVRVEIRDSNGQPIGSITAVGHEHAGVEDTLVPSFPEPQGAGAHVAVLHGTVVGSLQAMKHERYAPTDLGSLTATGYHYWALGHIHMREELADSPGIHYPGNTQGRSIRECGPKGCLLVDLAEPLAPQVTFHRLGTIQWEHLKLDDLGECHTRDGLLHVAKKTWAAIVSGQRADPPEDWIVRVTLSGPSPLHRDLSAADAPSELAQELADELGVLEAEVRIRGVYPPVRLEDHIDRKDVLGEALRLVRSLRNDDDAASLDGEPNGWPDTLAGIESGADRASYLSGLLDDAEVDILSRMLKTESTQK